MFLLQLPSQCRIVLNRRLRSFPWGRRLHRKGRGRDTLLQRVLNPEGPSCEALLPLGIEARQIFLDMGPNVEPSVLQPEQDILLSDPERDDQRAVAVNRYFPFPRAGEIEVSLLRQAQSITE